MDVSKTGEAEKTNTAEKPLDPFAVDFFGEKKTSPEKENVSSPARAEKSLNGNKKKSAKNLKWFENLPHLTRDEFLFSARLEKLPDNLTKAAAHKISETVTRYTLQPPKTVRCQMISITEVDLAATLEQLEKSPQTFLALGCQPENSTALMAFDAGFALSVIDLILSGKGDETNAPRRLSPVENTIIEFLAGNVLTGINEWVGQNLFCLQTIAGEPDSVFKKNERGAEAVFRLDFAEFSGIITVLASGEFLASIDKTENPLLARKNGKNKFEIIEKIAPHLMLRVILGNTTLEAESLAFLEPNDIVLIERPVARFENSEFTGNGIVNLGSGENFNLKGQFVNGGELSLKLEEIKSAAVWRGRNFDRFDMDNKKTETEEKKNFDETDELPEETNEGAEENAAALENILVNLRVEIAGDKISLREVQRLRPGQIINLGCRPTDTVRIVTDTSDEPVALGELVDIEGRLGVRLTRVFI